MAGRQPREEHLVLEGQPEDLGPTGKKGQEVQRRQCCRREGLMSAVWSGPFCIAWPAAPWVPGLTVK